MVWEEMSFEGFQDGRHGGHLGYQNGMILSILSLHVAPMPPTKFGLNLIEFGSRMRFQDFQAGHPGQAAILDSRMELF